MMIAHALSSLLFVASFVVSLSALSPPEPPCGVTATTGSGQVVCVTDPGQVVDAVNGNTPDGDNSVYTVRAACNNQGGGPYGKIDCMNSECSQNGEPGFNYYVYRDGVHISTVCLTAAQQAALGAVTPAMVWREVQEYSWEVPKLAITPDVPNQTIVLRRPLIMSTVISTQTRSLQLLGQRILVEVSPSKFIWHSSAGGESWETTDGGAPWPSRGSDVDSYVWARYGELGAVTPSVDVVYQGRFRVNGGAWQTIPETLTNSGPARTLTVVPAQGSLTDAH